MFNTSYGNENNGKGNRNVMYYNIMAQLSRQKSEIFIMN